MVLIEKGVRFDARIAVAGPPLFETYRPWYMHLNPGGTVPTLVCDGRAVTDSRDILHAVDQQFEGPALTPTDPGEAEEMHRWIAQAYDLPERILAYGSERLRAIGSKVNAARRRALTRQRLNAPELAQVYEAKIADIDRFMTEASDPTFAASLHQRLQTALNNLDKHLDTSEFVAGSSYSLADVVWTVTVARAVMRGDQPLAKRPNLAAWYERMRERPSFHRADIWERFAPWKLLPVLAAKLRLQLVVLLLVIAATVLLLRYC